MNIKANGWLINDLGSLHSSRCRPDCAPTNSWLPGELWGPDTWARIAPQTEEQWGLLSPSHKNYLTATYDKFIHKTPLLQSPSPFHSFPKAYKGGGPEAGCRKAWTRERGRTDHKLTRVFTLAVFFFSMEALKIFLETQRFLA